MPQSIWITQKKYNIFMLLGVEDDFLNKRKIINRKGGEFYYIKIWNFCISKDTTIDVKKKKKKQPTEWDKLFSTHNQKKFSNQNIHKQL